MVNSETPNASIGRQAEKETELSEQLRPTVDSMRDFIWANLQADGLAVACACGM